MRLAPPLPFSTTIWVPIRSRSRATWEITPTVFWFWRKESKAEMATSSKAFPAVTCFFSARAA